MSTIDTSDMNGLVNQLGNIAARAYGEGRFGEWGAIKAAMAFIEDNRSRVPTPPAPEMKARRGRKPKSDGANGTPASVSDLK